MSEIKTETIQTMQWIDDHLKILDQTFLPGRVVYTELKDVGHVWEAIKKMRVRGAPAIGIVAGYGFYLGIRDLPETNFNSFWIEAKRIADYLESSRPTAVNLSWAIKRLKNTVYANRKMPIDDIKKHILKIAKTIHEEDRRICQLIGLNGQEVVGQETRILTHCNTGGLATSQFGTALSVIYHAHKNNKNLHIWVDETRPLLQGARLTAWELSQAGIPMSLIVDSAAGSLMRAGKVDLVIVGADRITANGDTANKIGTYSLAVLAKAHGIPFYIAAPISTIDMDLQDGNDIVIEERDSEEIRKIGSKLLTPGDVNVYNPAFDVTPNEYITGIITEKGIVKPDFSKNLPKLFS